LEQSKHRLREGFQAVAFEIVEERDAKLLLIRALDETQVRLHSLPLLRLQVVEQVHLDGGGISEV
jgi:hypothetical protein